MRPVQYVLKQHNDTIRLVHLTTEDRIESIKKNGLLPSEYGDLSVGDNDGAGIYAIRSQVDAVKTLVKDHFSFCDETIFAVCFDYSGPYYECVDVILEEDDDELENPLNHKGYIVIPLRGYNANLRIDPEKFIAVVPVSNLFQRIKRPSLESQIQSVSSQDKPVPPIKESSTGAAYRRSR